MIRKAIKGGDVPPDIAFRILLYSYSMIFHINPSNAMHTPLNLMLEMLQVHAEIEEHKNDEMKKEMNKNKVR